MRLARVVDAAIVVAIVTCATIPAVAREDIAKFYADKTLNLIIGAPAGGVLDVPGRLVARYLSRHIPGRPNIISSNMPGAASNILGRHIFGQAPKDGLTIGMVFPGVATEALFNGDDRRGYDPSKFNFLGSAQNYVPTCVARADAPVQKAADLLTTDLIAGGTAPGNMTYDFPTIAKAIVGARFKMVKGYTSGPELMLAVERGELQATCSGWSIIKFKYPTILNPGSSLRPFLQGHMTGDPELNKASVPLISSLVRSENDLRALELFLSQKEYAGPFIAPPGVAVDRVAALRAAFIETTRDPDFLADAAKANIDVSATPGEEVQRLVARAYDSAPEVIARVKAALGR
jgi:tripartite-type tricarboxylate transporter receptor subunit TctC